MEQTIATDHCPSLLFKDRAGAVEAAQKLNNEYMVIGLIEFDGEIIGYGIYNPFREEFLEKDDLQR